MFAPQQTMTLRRFVRVTFDNFRQLIQAYATPVAALPMATTDTPPHFLDDETGLTPAEQKPSLEAREDATDQPPSPAPPGEEPTDVEMHIAEATPDDAARDESEEACVEHPGIAARKDPTGPTEPEVAAALGTTGTEETVKATLEGAPAVTALALAAALESLLFVAEEPVEPAQLARVFGGEATQVEAALHVLEEEYRTQRRGLRIQVRSGRYQMVTAPEAAGLIEIFLNLDTSSKLSGPALETLAVVAYRQPVTRAQIEAVRGVDCSGVLRSLLQRGLIEEVGRMETPGRPVLYGVTDLFMRHFGLMGLHELPPLPNEENSRIDEIIRVEENPPAV